MTIEHYGQERQETALAKAERIVGEELKRLRWSEGTLELRRKGDVDKIRIAQRLRRETTMTLVWIAERLRMGTKTHLTHLIYWDSRRKRK